MKLNNGVEIDDEIVEKIERLPKEAQKELEHKIEIIGHIDRTVEYLLDDVADFSDVERQKLLDLRNRINRELEDDEGLTMSEEDIMDTKVKNLTGVEAVKGIKMISEHVERDLQDER